MLRVSADRAGDSAAWQATTGSASGSPLIRRVSDTAFWTAGIRAREQTRAAPAYIDPLAAFLSGDKGRQISQRLAHATEIDWGVSMRTVSIDRMVQAAVAAGADSVLSIGAGLDARPYRLELPRHLVWVEADLPEIIEFKNAKLADVAPRCGVERVAADLVSASGRRRMLSRIIGGFRSTLIIAEGVLPYLSGQEVAALASELHDETHATEWIVDFDAGGLDWGPGCRRELRAVPRRFQFPHLLAFLRFSGWEAATQIGTGEEAQRLERPYPLRLPRSLFWRVLPAAWKAHIQNSSGVALLRRI